MADYTAQAVISTILHNAFPEDPIVGEEDAADLRAGGLAGRIAQLANDALRAELGADEQPAWGIGPGHSPYTVEDILTAIDRGSSSGSPTGRQFHLHLHQPLFTQLTL